MQGMNSSACSILWEILQNSKKKNENVEVDLRVLQRK
jgi:hypothetical protein